MNEKNYSIKIANLIFFLQKSKSSLTNFVQKLTVEELDFEIHKNSNSIGTLLKHIAALECRISVRTFEDRPFSVDEKNLWRGSFAGQMMEKRVRNLPIEYYIELWDKIRNNTCYQFLQKTDAWLSLCPLNQIENNNKGWDNYYYWYHLLEDQLCHFGQIKLIVKDIQLKYQSKLK